MESALFDLIMWTLFLVFKVGPYAVWGTIPLAALAVWIFIPTWKKKPEGKRRKPHGGRHRKLKPALAETV